MFVRQSTFNKLSNNTDEWSRYAGYLKSRLETYEREHARLAKQWNELVEKINAKGGEDFLNGNIKPFTEDELTKLIQLCHPDKHGGKSMAVEMTQKLLQMKKDIK